MRQRAFARSAVKLAVAALLVFAVLGLMGCYYMPGLAGSGGTARASIGLGKALPANLTGTFTLIVGGPGMSTITRQYQLGTTTSEPLSIPSGASRTFTLIANTPSVTLIGQQTVDLAPGETKDVTLTPVAAGSQIIVPDYVDARLVQISDMKGTEWTTLMDATAGLNPYDIDFDDQGKIYIADPVRGLLTTPDITVTPVAVAGVASQSLYSIGMDRARGLLFYVGYVVTSAAYELHSIKVTPSLGPDTKIDLAALNVTLNYNTAVAADLEGFVYLTSTSTAQVLKIDPTVPSIAASYTGTITTPWDVLVKGDYVYVSDQGNSFSSIQGKIIRLSKNLNFVDDFSGPPSDPVFGPERFVAILNKPITVIDQNNSEARLVSFGDMTGAGWTTYGSRGTGPDQFEFYGGSG